jgi:hypothetical protein
MICTITTDLDTTPWSDLPPPPDTPTGIIERVGRLTKGTSGGHSVVFVLIRLGDGQMVTGQVKLSHLEVAMAAFRGAEERDGIKPPQTGGN